MDGVCLCSARWRDAHAELMPDLESLLRASNYGLKFISGSTSPDFIVTSTSGTSVAFIVVTSAEYLSRSTLWERVARMGSTFQKSYVLATITSEDENLAFIEAYFSFMETFKTPMIQIQDNRLAGEMMIEIAQSHAELKRQGVSASVRVEVHIVDVLPCMILGQFQNWYLLSATLNDNNYRKIQEIKQFCKEVDGQELDATLDDIELKRFRQTVVSSDEAYVAAISSIRGLETHDANSDVANASGKNILEKTDLSDEKARAIVKFFNNNASKHVPKLD